MAEAEEKYNTRAFFFVAGQLFCNSSGARGPFYILELFRDFRPYAWAFCCLANLYRMLNKGVHWEGLKKGEILDPTDENNAFGKKFKSLSALLQLLQIWVYFIMKIGRGFRPNQHQNYDIQFPLMVIWAHWLTGLTHLTTVREVHKQLNDLMSDERMPPAFVKHIVMDASQTAKLKVPSGHSWRVQLSKMVTGTYLHDGWLEFVKDNSLKDFDLLLFRYDGNRCFTVWIFDKTTCERGGNYLQHSSRHCLLQWHHTSVIKEDTFRFWASLAAYYSQHILFWKWQKQPTEQPHRFIANFTMQQY